jgi:ribA/ribD-fused uncharacterized protein
MKNFKYNLNWLINHAGNAEKPVKFTFFWGHKPLANGVIGKSCFSQWWPCPFEVEGVRFATAEHWMMVKKAKLFGDQEIAQQILENNSPENAKKLGRLVKNFDPMVWKDACFDIVCEGNWHKFSQNEDLKAFLLETDNSILVEASPVDRIWGIGMAQNSANANFPKKWLGQNLLGFALMEVRDRFLN